MYTSQEFKAAWQEWKTHKQEKHGSPYTETSESMALRMLYKKSHGIEDLAIQSIEESIERNWASIFIKKDYNNGKSSVNGGNSAASGKARGTSSDRMEAASNW